MHKHRMPQRKKSNVRSTQWTKNSKRKHSCDRPLPRFFRVCSFSVQSEAPLKEILFSIIYRNPLYEIIFVVSKSGFAKMNTRNVLKKFVIGFEFVHTFRVSSQHISIIFNTTRFLYNGVTRRLYLLNFIILNILLRQIFKGSTTKLLAVPNDITQNCE